jgi:hypothetical protein
MQALFREYKESRKSVVYFTVHTCTDGNICPKSTAAVIGDLVFVMA